MQRGAAVRTVLLKTECNSLVFGRVSEPSTLDVQNLLETFGCSTTCPHLILCCGTAKSFQKVPYIWCAWLSDPSVTSD